MTLDRGAAALIALSRAAGRPPIEELSVEEARAAVAGSAAMLGGDPVPMDEVRDLTIDAPEGPLGLRLYRPPNIAPEDVSPGLVFLHGGGWLVGDLETHDRLCRKIAQAGDTRVIAVDYRRAPESRFPAAVEDTARAIRWVAAHARELRIDSRRLGVGGDSAGGNLAAVAALMARDGDLPPLSLQLLLYPVCDLTMAHESHRRNAEGYLLTHATMRYFIESYVATREDIHDWRASPLKAEVFAKLPPTFLLTAGYDPLCDEGRDYAGRLVTAGVAVEHMHLPGQVHGLLTANAIVPEAQAVIDRIGLFLQSKWQR